MAACRGDTPPRPPPPQRPKVSVLSLAVPPAWSSILHRIGPSYGQKLHQRKSRRTTVHHPRGVDDAKLAHQQQLSSQNYRVLLLIRPPGNERRELSSKNGGNPHEYLLNRRMVDGGPTYTQALHASSAGPSYGLFTVRYIPLRVTQAYTPSLLWLPGQPPTLEQPMVLWSCCRAARRHLIAVFRYTRSHFGPPLFAESTGRWIPLQRIIQLGLFASVFGSRTCLMYGHFLEEGPPRGLTKCRARAS